MAIAGKVAITPKGEWNAQTAYTKLDLVFYDNASYVAIQPSTGVEPTNESYWMLMVQSAGGADLEAIIDGTQQVGNAKTLDGHGAEYFAPLADLANYLPKTGGELSKDSVVVLSLKNTVSDYNFLMFNGASGSLGCLGFAETGNPIYLHPTNSAQYQLLHTGNMADHVLPLTGGRIEGTTHNPLIISNKNDTTTTIEYYGKGTFLGSIGFNAPNNLVTYLNDKWNTILHTGNKPTGTYTGNGSAYQNVAVGGTGEFVLVSSNVSGEKSDFVLVSHNGYFGKVGNAVVQGNNMYTTSGGNLIIDGVTAFLVSGIQYRYERL